MTGKALATRIAGPIVNSDCSASHLSDMVLDLALLPVRCQRAAHRLEEATKYRRSLPTNTILRLARISPDGVCSSKPPWAICSRQKQCLLHN
jgi:hypothetical protein